MMMSFNRAHLAAAIAVTLPVLFAGCDGGPTQSVANYDSNYVQPSPDVRIDGAGAPVDPRTGVEITGATRPER
ncbi:MAG TPA: hypothetical protein VET85_10665 [Stellaceae bacterium]|nr:hypothetical protein [Stellaceae bacterium]